MDGIYGTDLLTLPIGWLTGLATSDLRLAIYAMRSLYGVTRFLHLVSMATFVGLVVLIDLRGLGLFPPGSLDPVRKRLGAVLSAAFWTAIATGVLLFLRDPVGVGLHTMFLPKLLLIVSGFVLARWVRRARVVRRSLSLSQGGAALSLALWIAVIGASTWNAVERPVRPGEALRLHTLGR